jgi:hypothetical protein
MHRNARAVEVARLMKVFLLEGEGSQIAAKYIAYRPVARDLRDEGSESSFFPEPRKRKNRIATCSIVALNPRKTKPKPDQSRTHSPRDNKLEDSLFCVSKARDFWLN